MFAIRHPLVTALCAAETSADRAALCFALTEGDAADLATPQWRELIPAPNAQGKVQGIDGRWWRMTDPQAIASSFQLALAVDLNHSSELVAPKGGDAPAYGWVEKLEVREGAVWGLVAWNADGQNAVAGKKYRYLSPVFKFDPTSREIKRLTSIALVNEPNFPLALNRAADQEIPPVDEAIRIALGLPEKATPDQAVTAINSIRSSVTTPPLDKFVPRADYDTALNRATTAETSLRERDETAKKASIDAAIDGALKAGKITPATVDYHKASCAAEGGLERFTAFVAAAATVGDVTGLDGKKPEGDQKALNAATTSIAGMFGLTAEDIAKYGQEKA